MSMTLWVSVKRLSQLGAACTLEDRLKDAAIVAVSGVLVTDLDSPRFTAVLDTVRSSQEANVPHLIMLDSASHDSVAGYLERRGAIVVTIDHDSERGLARPYVIAAQLIDLFASPDAVMVKFEGEKPLFAEGRNVQTVLESLSDFDITTGVRSRATWDSMPPYQALTERWLGFAIGQVLDISVDTPSGVLVLGRGGRRVLIHTTEQNSWPYLFKVPYLGREMGCTVGSIEVDFRYHPAVISEETGNSDFDKKRRDQLELMMHEATLMAEGGESPQALQLVACLNDFQRNLERLA
jgi:hypothetical protein